jgi:hypothetical protein
LLYAFKSQIILFLIAFFINENPIGFTRDISYTDKEVKKMSELKGWPFEPLKDEAEPCNGIGNGIGPGVPG